MYIWMVIKIMVPVWGPLSTSCRIVLRTQKRTIILTTTYMVITEKNLHGGS